MGNTVNRDEFIKDVANDAHFTQGDVKIILNSIVTVLERYVKDNITAKVRGLGKLYHQIIPERKGKDGQQLPETTRTIFRLSDNIRSANKE